MGTRLRRPLQRAVDVDDAVWDLGMYTGTLQTLQLPRYDGPRRRLSKWREQKCRLPILARIQYLIETSPTAAGLWIAKGFQLMPPADPDDVDSPPGLWQVEIQRIAYLMVDVVRTTASKPNQQRPKKTPPPKVRRPTTFSMTKPFGRASSMYLIDCSSVVFDESGSPWR